MWTLLAAYTIFMVGWLAHGIYLYIHEVTLVWH